MFKHYVSYLQATLEQRTRRNPNYSLRAFARDLNISVSSLYEVLNGKGGLSALKASQIVKKIGLKGYDREVFLTSVSAAHGRSQSKKKTAEVKLRSLLKTIKTFSIMDLDRFKFISEWHYLAILELARLDDFKPHAGWIAKKLNVEVEIVKESLERLERLGFIKTKNGRFKVVEIHTETISDVPSDAIRAFHASALALSGQRLSTVPVDQREYRTMFFAVQKRDLIEMKSKIREFQQNFFNVFDPKSQSDSVYALSIQLFPVVDPA